MSESSTALTPLQLDILAILWDRGQATSAEVRDLLAPAHTLALSTVATLLGRLERRRVVAHRREGRQYIYRPLVTRGSVRESRVRELTEALFDGDPAALVSHLIRSDEVDANEIQRIRDLLEGHRTDGDAS